MQPRFNFLMLFLLATTAVAQTKAPADDKTASAWSQFRGGPQQQGVAAEVLEPPLAVAWTAKIPEGIASTAAITGGTVYVGGLDGKLYAFDLATGEKRWSYDAEDEIKSSPLVHQGTVYFGDEYGKFHALDAKSGKARWTFEADSSITGSANVAGGCILFGGYDNVLYCLGTDGEPRWKLETMGYVHGTPAVWNGRAISSGCDGFLRTVDLESGRELSQLEIGGYVSASTAIDGDRAYFGTMDNVVVAVDLKKNEKLWTFRPEREFPFYSSAALGDGLVIVGGRDKRLRALDAATGKERWSHPRRARVDASPVISGPNVYAADQAGSLFALDVESGELVWEFESGDGFTASPAIAGSRLVIGDEGGTLYAFERKKPRGEPAL